MKKKIIVSVIVGVIIVGGGSFYAGTKYASSSRAPEANFTSQMRGSQSGFGMGMRGGQGLGGVTMGEIISKDGTSITVKLPNGGSRIVFFTGKTAITKNITGSIADLVVNENVVVNGSANTDGSINAQTIQLGSISNLNK
ncbi:MAG: hypothetical protein PHT16_01580 [Candidatus Pacebacteria bacterium]|nr:hypothetical protein [Candidatus Paceibacterota bacterium]